MYHCRHAIITALLLSALLAACTHTATHTPREHEWREGNVIHYTDGYDYQVYVDLSEPSYHVSLGKYYEAIGDSATHFHVAHNPKGLPQIVRCFAHRHDDGTWHHEPQWHELDPRRRTHRDRYGR